MKRNYAAVMNRRGLCACLMALYFGASGVDGMADAVPGATLVSDTTADLAQLLDGVTTIGAPGAPGEVAVFGPQAFAIVAGGAKESGRVAVVAAARSGKGRLVAFAHNGYFNADALNVADTGRLMANCVRWAAGEKKALRVATWQQEHVRKFLLAQGLKVQALSKPEAASVEADVIILGMNGLNPGQEKAMSDFVAQGGGVITSDCPWGWLQLSGGKSLKTDMIANRLLMPAGLAFAGGMADRTADVGYAAAKAPGNLINAFVALDLLESLARAQAKPTKSELQQAGLSVTAAVRALPPTDTLLMPRMRKLAAEFGARLLPSPKTPLKATEGLARVLLAMQLEDLEKLPPEQTKAHPAAASFPGAIPDGAPRVTKELKFDGGTPGWQSTGLYAAPGEVIEIALNGVHPVKGLAIRIGAHHDGIWHHDQWSRMPEVTRQWPVKDAVMRLASAFGGLIYIVVPEGDKIGEFKVQVRNAVEAPLFVLGQTEVKDWCARLRELPGPWAELATKKVILTVPSGDIRKLEDPVALMQFWDRVLDAEAELAGRSKERERPERIVSDVQISAGYMHSGYPIMTHMDAAPRMVDLAVMKQGDWGLFHELGHNHQSGDWTFDGTVEVTCNLFTLFVFDKVCSKKPREARGDLAAETRNKTLKHYLSTCKFSKWKEDPFLALTMYVQLQEGFGWDTFEKLFAEYRDLPKGQHPKNDHEKRDQWMVRFSKAAGKNLGPFFEAWGVPTSEKARKEVSDLPRWMPADWPKQDGVMAPQK